MGKCALIFKGGACRSTILMAAEKGFTALYCYHDGVSLFLPCAILCSTLLGIAILWYRLSA